MYEKIADAFECACHEIDFVQLDGDRMVEEGESFVDADIDDGGRLSVRFSGICFEHAGASFTVSTNTEYLQPAVQVKLFHEASDPYSQV